MQRKCVQCGAFYDAAEPVCPSCGAKYSTEGPQTIEELKAWCEARNLTPERTRFFVGENYKKPKAFGIYQDSKGDFIVYKNKANGQRAVRYSGPDEAFAVSELYARLLEEIDNQRHLSAVRRAGTGAPGSRVISGSQETSASPEESGPVRVKKCGNCGAEFSADSPDAPCPFCGAADKGIYETFPQQTPGRRRSHSRKRKRERTALWLFIAVLALLLPMMFLFGDKNRRGYYRLGDTIYYCLSDVWYYWDDTGDSWVRVSSGTLPEELSENAKDYYDSGYYSAEYNTERFEDTYEYRKWDEERTRRNNDHDDDYDNDDWDFDWDIGGTDWDSDW